MSKDWITVEFLGGPLDGALRPVQVGVAVYYLANGAVIHAYAIDEIHEGHSVRQVMRHHEVLNVSNWFA
jgi:urease gamma subunit